MQVIREKIKVINKQTLNLNDISILMDCGRHKARQYRNKYFEKNKIVNDYFGTQVPTTEFIKFYNINTEIVMDSYLLLKETGDLDASSS